MRLKTCMPAIILAIASSSSTPSLFTLPANANGICEAGLEKNADNNKSTGQESKRKDVGWCRLHELGPSGETVYIFTDQQHVHARPRHVYLSYNRSQSYKRYLLDCESGTISMVTPKGEAVGFAPIAGKLNREIFESVCTENNRLITVPTGEPSRWPPTPSPPPLSL